MTRRSDARSPSRTSRRHRLRVVHKVPVGVGVGVGTRSLALEGVGIPGVRARDVCPWWRWTRRERSASGVGSVLGDWSGEVGGWKVHALGVCARLAWLAGLTRLAGVWLRGSGLIPECSGVRPKVDALRLEVESRTRLTRLAGKGCVERTRSIGPDILPIESWHGLTGVLWKRL